MTNPHDIAFSPPSTNLCPECGERHRLLTPSLAASIRALGGDDDDIALLQEESDDLAASYGSPGHKAAPRSAEQKRADARERVRRHREKKRRET